MELRPSLHLSVVAIEKGAFESLLTTVANFTYFTNTTDDDNNENENNIIAVS